MKTAARWRWWQHGGAWLFAAAATACGGNGDDLDIGPRPVTSAALVQFESCGELGAELRANIKEEMRTRLLQLEDYYVRSGPPMAGGVDDAAATNESSSGGTPRDSAGGREEGKDFSGTNNQEEGVDEADFLKTDGYHVYLINGTRLEILGVPEFGELTKESTTKLEGWPTQMLIGSGRVAVFSQIYPWNLPVEHPLRAALNMGVDENGWWYGGDSLVKVTILDVADAENPAVLRELYFEGYYQTGRRVDSSVRLIQYSYFGVNGLQYYPQLDNDYYNMPWESAERQAKFREAVAKTIQANNELIDSTSLDDLVPAIYEKLADGSIIQRGFEADGCTNFAVADDAMSHGFTSIISFDLTDADVGFESDHIVTNWSQVYASQDTLIIAENAWDWWWFWDNNDWDESTNLHRFDISVAGKTTYTGSGRVPGYVQDQFSLSELDGYLRVATTTGRWNRWWLPAEEQTVSSSHVYVLAGDQALDVVGHVGGIAPGERIWSVRFVGDKGYMVTFRNIDPLFTLDLSSPAAPTVKGELKVPGVSTYIHPLDDGHLLTIGMGGNEEGLDWGHTQLSLFDVTDFEHPALQDAIDFAPPPGDGWSYAWSEATYEHKAFQFWAPKAMLAIPLSTYRGSYDNFTGYYEYEYSSRLQLVNVSVENGLSIHGTVDHSGFFNSDRRHWWYYTDVRRSIFMGDFVYAVSDRGVTAHKLDDLTLSASVGLPGYDDEVWYYGWE